MAQSAPRAMARTTSSPLRMPESARILIWPFTASHFAGRGAGTHHRRGLGGHFVVGDDDAVRAKAHSILGVLGLQDALDDHRSLPEGANPLQVFPARWTGQVWPPGSPCSSARPVGAAPVGGDVAQVVRQPSRPTSPPSAGASRPARCSGAAGRWGRSCPMRVAVAGPGTGMSGTVNTRVVQPAAWARSSAFCMKPRSFST